MSNAWTRKYNTKPLQIKSTQIVNCTPCRAEPCLQQNSEALLKVYNRRMYNYVRVPSSLYMGTLGALNTFNGSRGGVYGLRWNQSSDKKLAHVGKAIVPSRGNSTRGSITRHRPGAGAPGGVGVDIKHNSFQRYLNRKKGATVPSGPYVGAQVNPKSVTNNKVQKSSIITTKNTIDCVCDVTECVFRETITLEQALAQGGVLDCQDLVITQQTNYEYIFPGDAPITSVVGLLINGITFTIAKTATVTIATDINGLNKRAYGILADNGGKLINNGKINFGEITSNNDRVQAIFLSNDGEIRNGQTGIIEFNGELKSIDSSNNSSIRGIQLRQTSKFFNDGKISFDKITSYHSSVGIIQFESSEFRNGQTGIIEFNGEIESTNYIIDGINLENNSKFFNDGKITFDRITATISSIGIFQTSSSEFRNEGIGSIEFKGEIKSNTTFVYGMELQQTSKFFNDGKITFDKLTGVTQAYGIFNQESGSFEQNGAITFKGAISSSSSSDQSKATGIFNTGSSFQTNGAITFEGAISGQINAYGIDNNGSFEQSSGTITFEGTISGSSGGAVGILNEGSSFQTNGAIKFEGAISGDESGTFGIINKGSLFETNGAITFKDNSLTLANFNPQDASTITGTGTITYGTNPVNTYYSP